MLNDINNSILKKYTIIGSIGNDNLLRNQVVLMEANNIKYILKIYSRDENYFREIYVLNLMNSLGYKQYKINETGYTIKNKPYIIYNYIEGVTFKSYYEKLQVNDFKNLGQIVGRMHSENKFDYFGGWNGITKKEYMSKSFKKYIGDLFNRRYNYLVQNNEVEQIYEVAYSKFYKNLDTLEYSDTPRFCFCDLRDDNILIDNENKDRSINLIDYEQCCSGDRYKDLYDYYLRLNNSSPLYAEKFLEGYTKYLNIDTKLLSSMKIIYDLYTGVSLRSWTRLVSEELYVEGLKRLEEQCL